jgi:two-component system sensor histidine kinase UhpB
MSISDPASAAAALPSLLAPRDRLGGWLDGRGRTLVLLMVAAVLPLLVFGGIAGLLSAQRTRAATRSLAVQLVGRSAERISIEVDAQLDLSQALAESTALDRGDFAAFGTEVQRLTALHPLWQGIVLTAPDGRTLFSSTLPAAARLGAATDQTSFRQVLRTSRPSVGGVAPAGLGPTTATLRVPVLRQGVLRYVLSLAVAPDAVGAILDSAGLPPGWIGVVVDAGGHVLARTGDAHESLGQLAGLGLLDAIAPGRPGFTIATTRRGIKVETVARVLPRTGGWVVAFGIPIQTLQHPVDQALLVLAGVGCASACLAAMLASLVTRELHQRRARERERAAQALQASEARRALAVDAAELGTWRWDIAADRFEASPRCRSMLDLSPPPPAERWQDALAAMHPDDRAGFDRAVAAALDHGTGTPLSAEFRIRLPDGGARWRARATCAACKA